MVSRTNRRGLCAVVVAGAALSLAWAAPAGAADCKLLRTAAPGGGYDQLGRPDSGG